MKNTFGSDLSLTIFGESHGRAIGAVLDGMAAGLPVDETFLADCMDKAGSLTEMQPCPAASADAAIPLGKRTISAGNTTAPSGW